MSAPKYLRLLLLGQSGVGKTRLAITTAPEGGVYVINSDIGNATQSAKQCGRAWEESELVDTPQKFEMAYKTALKLAAEGKASTVVWDTLSEFARATLELETAASPNNPQAAYGNMGRRVLSSVTRLVKNLPAHLILVAHSAFDEAGDTELDIPGQSGRRVPALLDDCWLLRKQGNARLLTRKPGGVLKSRTTSDDCLELEANIAALWEKAKA